MQRLRWAQRQAMMVELCPACAFEPLFEKTRHPGTVGTRPIDSAAKGAHAEAHMLLPYKIRHHILKMRPIRRPKPAVAPRASGQGLQISGADMKIPNHLADLVKRDIVADQQSLLSRQSPDHMPGPGQHDTPFNRCIDAQTPPIGRPGVVQGIKPGQTKPFGQFPKGTFSHEGGSPPITGPPHLFCVPELHRFNLGSNP